MPGIATSECNKHLCFFSQITDQLHQLFDEWVINFSNDLHDELLVEGPTNRLNSILLIINFMCL